MLVPARAVKAMCKITTDETRPALHGIQVKQDGLYCSDSYSIVHLAGTLDVDHVMLFPFDAAKGLKASDQVDFQQDHATVLRKGDFVCNIPYEECREVNFEPFMGTKPFMDGKGGCEWNHPFDPKYVGQIMDVFQAMNEKPYIVHGKGGVKLRFMDKSSNVRALLMGCR